MMDEIYDVIFNLILGVVLFVGVFLSIPILFGALVLGIVVFFDRKNKNKGDENG